MISLSNIFTSKVVLTVVAFVCFSQSVNGLWSVRNKNSVTANPQIRTTVQSLQVRSPDSALQQGAQEIRNKNSTTVNPQIRTTVQSLQVRSPDSALQQGAQEIDKYTVASGNKQVVINVNHSTHRIAIDMQGLHMESRKLNYNCGNFNGIDMNAPLNINADMSKEEVLAALRATFSNCQIEVQ